MAVTLALLTTQSFSSSSSDISAYRVMVISSSITFLTTCSTLPLDFVTSDLCVRMSSSLLNESSACFELCLLGIFDAAIVAIR